MYKSRVFIGRHQFGSTSDRGSHQCSFRQQYAGDSYYNIGVFTKCGNSNGMVNSKIPDIGLLFADR